MKKVRMSKILMYSILVIYALITIFPFIWALSSSFKPVSEITSGGLSIIPQNFTLDAYMELLGENGLFFRWLGNSLFLATTVTFFNVLFNTMAGYSLARIKFRGQRMVLNIVIVCITVPAQILLIPNYLIVTNMGLNDTYTAVILISAINASYIIMMRQFFINFPREIEEAAVLDGLNRWQILFKMGFPIAKPALSTQALFIFMGTWNEFLKTKLYLSSQEKYSVTVGLQSLSQSEGDIIPWDLILASSIMSILPMLILYILLNKYFLSGVRVGGEK